MKSCVKKQSLIVLILLGIMPVASPARYLSSLFSVKIDESADQSSKDTSKQERIQLKEAAREERAAVKQIRSEERTILSEQHVRLIRQWKDYRRSQYKDAVVRGKFADLYHVPAVPVWAWHFRHSMLFSIDFLYKEAEKAFGSGGKRHDLAHEVFGESCFTLKEILPEAHLLERGLLARPGSPDEEDAFLEYLADTQLRLNAHKESWQFAFNFARFVARNDIVLGISLPLKHVEHELDVCITPPKSALDCMTKTTQSGGSLFRTEYGGSIDRFFCDVLARKGIEFKPRDTKFGWGDVQLYAHAHLHSHHWEDWLFGLRVSAPTGAHRSPVALWGPELGTGIPSLSLFTSLSLSLDYKINPYFFGEVTFSFPVLLQRRIPRCISFNGQTGGGNGQDTVAADGTTIEDLFVFPEHVEFIEGTSFERLETCLGPFASRSHIQCGAYRVKYGHSFDVSLTVGNVFEQSIFRRGFLDVFYNLRFKQKDSILKVKTAVPVNTTILRHHTTRIAHRIGAEYSYQFDGQSRVRAGVTWTFDGRNTEDEVDLIATYAFHF